MKLLITGIVALITLAVGFWGCNDLSRTTYSGSDYVMFSDTLSMYPVQDSEKWFEIPVVATNICDYDRSFGVEVDDKASNAIEKKQYVVESNTVTIKAGERVAKFRMKRILCRLRSICLPKMKMYGICTVPVLVFKCKKHVLSNLVHLKAIVY